MKKRQQGYIAWLEQQVETLRSESERKDEMIKALREGPLAGQRTEAARMPSDAELQQDMIDSMARHLAQMPEHQRDEVIDKAKAWGQNCAYVPEINPAERLAVEVSKLNGYGLGAFMQRLMKIGISNQERHEDL